MNKNSRKILITLGAIAVLVTVLLIGYKIFENSVFGMQLMSEINKKSPEQLKQLVNLRNSMDKIKNNPNTGTLMPPETKKELKELVKQYQTATKNSTDPDKANEILQAIMGTKNPKLISLLCDYAEDGVSIKNNQPGFDSYYKMKFQVSSVYALGNIGDRKAASCLTNMLDDNSILACSASVTLGKLGVTEAMGKMIKNMENTNYCSIAGFPLFGKEGLQVIMTKLNDSSLSDDKRYELIKNIYFITDSEAKPILKELYGSTNLDIRRFSGHALYINASSEDYDFYIDVLKNIDFGSEKCYAIDALGKIGNKKAGPIIEIIWKESNVGSNEWMSAFRVLSKLEGQSFYPELIKFVYDKNYEVAEQAIRGLKYCNPEDATNVLMQIIDFHKSNPNYYNSIAEQTELNYAIIDSLGSINSQEAVYNAIQLTKSDNDGLVIIGISSLTKLSNINEEFKKYAIENIQLILDKEISLKLKKYAISQLAQIKDDKIIQILEKYTNDPLLGEEATNRIKEINGGK